jgi:hypothetical protein
MKAESKKLLEMAEEIKTYDPKLWELCCPRKYIGVDGFRTVEIPAFSFFSSILSVEQTQGFPDHSSKNIYRVAWHLISQSVPTLFVHRDFGEAVRMTSPPPDILWTEAHLPHETALLMLPAGLFEDVEGNPLPFVSYSRMRKGQLYWAFGKEFEVTADVLTIYAMSMIEGPHSVPVSFEMTLNGETGPAANIQDIRYPSALSKQEDDWLRELAQFVLKFALIIESRPALMSPGAMVRKAGKGKSALWSPNVVGRGFGAARERGEGQSTTGRATVRTHWRRGHLRNQAYGEARALRKILWIEPVLVG